MCTLGGFDDACFDPMDHLDQFQPLGGDEFDQPPQLLEDASDAEDRNDNSSDSDFDDDDWALPQFHADWFRAERAQNIKPPCTRQPPKAPLPACPTTIVGDFYPAKQFSGAVPGFYFGTSGKDTGYFRLRPTAAPRQIVLDDLIHTVPDNEPLPKKEPARHRRDQNGKRIRGVKKVTAWGDPDKLPAILNGYGDLIDVDWKECGLWAIDTSNPNSWTSAEVTVMLKSTADVILVQESKRYGKATPKMVMDARQIGWSAVASDALRTAADKASGGCVVAVKKGAGIEPHPDSLVKDGFAHRAKFAWVSGFCSGGLHCGSVYLCDGVGLNDTNLEILQEIAGALKVLRGPWILGGDWNLTPSVLAGSKWLDMIGGMIVAPDAPTCHSSTYDFFVIDRRLHSSVAGVARMNDAGTNPHWPSRLFLRSQAQRHLTRQLVRPAKVNGALPYGPLPNPDAHHVQPPTSVDKEAVDAGFLLLVASCQVRVGLA